MHTSKSQRLTIRAHNIEFLKILAVQMGISDLSEVINYLLLDCKGLGYSFGNKPIPQSAQSAPIGFEPFQPAFTPNRDVDRNERNYSEDPIIARMSQLIEDF